MVVATVIQLSTRGTVGSDNWFMGLVEQPVPRSYHLQDNDWTPLSQNLCWKATIHPISVFTRSDRLRPNTILSRLSGTEIDKSFVDDFDFERSIVSLRVGLSYDLLRLSSCSVICTFLQCFKIVEIFISNYKNSLSPQYNHTNTSHKYNTQQTHTQHISHHKNYKKIMQGRTVVE